MNNGDIFFDQEKRQYRKVIRVTNDNVESVPFFDYCMEHESVIMLDDNNKVGIVLNQIFAQLEIPKQNRDYIFRLLKVLTVPSITHMPIVKNKVWNAQAIDYSPEYGTEIVDPNTNTRYTNDEAKQQPADVKSRLIMVPKKIGAYVDMVVKQHGKKD